ncbi:MAG: type III ribulose-bisphosphate carboxylase [Candidatus Aenigmarchaeota archaeon]|nr:type III ribulose-bisphosphate carboxylase [Candidatus Aenigmarchaeota archaeon]
MTFMLNYTNLKYKPTDKDLVCEFYVEPNKVTMEKACEQVAAESSIGTWTTISTMNPRIAEKLRPTVFSVKGNTVKIAYPQDLFEAGNMPEILSSIAGNIFGMKTVKNLRLNDIMFPKSIVKAFKGPRFGKEGVRKLTKVNNRPLCGTIVKPKVGLNPAEHAKVAYEAWAGGLDIVKDDENLSSMTFNKFETRIAKTLEARDNAQSETGEKKIYMPNITAETMKMLERAEYVKSLGGEYIMVDILTCGWAGLQTVRDANLNMIIHAHRAGHAAFTRNKKHGISMKVIGKVARVIGVDQLHIGTAVGKMEGSADEVVDIKKGIEEEMHGIRPVLAVSSGGLHPGHTPDLVKILGKDIVAQYGGGCHGHPEGTRSGAIAIRQSIEAATKGITLKEYAKSRPELALALKKWG